jgi:Zn-finger nucleic acid-binding protein|tara:strand:+ start:189 stop:608 length:420 start_codon:yes stop_codon:yes gene_type:complete
MKCPKCAAQLSPLPAADITLDKCHSCDGIWLDYGELKKLRESSAQGIEQDLEEQFGSPEASMQNLDGYQRCPSCEDSGLRSIYVSYIKPVRVDRCPSCYGMWLEKNELNTLLQDKQQLDNIKVEKGLKDLLLGLVKKLS